MKKIGTVLVFMIVTMTSLQMSAQDIVKVGDPWYMFKGVGHKYDRGGYSGRILLGDWIGEQGGWNHSKFAINPYVLADYSPDSNFRVYGVAIASRLVCTGKDTQPCVLLTNRKESWYTGDSTYAIDTASYEQCIRQCLFELEYRDASPDTFDFYEYYFDHPWAASALADTFSVGLYLTTENEINYRNNSDCEDAFYILYGFHSNTSNGYKPFLVEACGFPMDISLDERKYLEYLVTWRHHQPFPPEYDTLNYITYSRGHEWACIFPIVGLRCVAPKASLVERADGMATVRWTQAEAGMEYQVAYGPYNVPPDSATVLTLTDTFCTVPEMNTGGVQGVWVRKACRYLTGGYDTTVWSNWSKPVLFRVESTGMEQVYREGVHIGVREGMIAVEDDCGELPEVWVYDMMGRCLWRRAGGRSQQVAVPAGVYAVRVGDSPARKVTVLR